MESPVLDTAAHDFLERGLVLGIALSNTLQGLHGLEVLKMG